MNALDHLDLNFLGNSSNCIVKPFIFVWTLFLEFSCHAKIVFPYKAWHFHKPISETFKFIQLQELLLISCIQIKVYLYDSLIYFVLQFHWKTTFFFTHRLVKRCTNQGLECCFCKLIMHHLTFSPNLVGIHSFLQYPL